MVTAVISALYVKLGVINTCGDENKNIVHNCLPIMLFDYTSDSHMFRIIYMFPALMKNSSHFCHIHNKSCCISIIP